MLVVVLGVGLIGGIVASAMVVRVLIDRKRSLEAAAEELEAHRHPVRVVHWRLFGGAIRTAPDGGRRSDRS